MEKVRTTIRIQRSLHRAARQAALQQGKTLQELIEDGLMTALTERKIKRRPIKIPGYHLGKIKGRLDRSSIYG